MTRRAVVWVAGAVVLGAGMGTAASAILMSGSSVPAPVRASVRVDLGAIWGRAFAARATVRESLASAARQANQVPAGASVNRRANVVRSSAGALVLTAVANPPGARSMAFRIAGLENPTIEVRRGARVTLRLVNADSDSAHGWMLIDPVVSIGGTAHGPRAFGAFAPILADATSAGLPVETVSFRASETGRLVYECPVPGHAAMGMRGTLIVS